MFTEIAQITDATSGFNNDTVQVSLRKRWDGDFNLYRLEPYDAGRGYVSYTSNAPRVFADRVLTRLFKAKALIRIPPETLTEAQRKEASMVERFLYGVYKLNDERLAAMLLPSLQAQMAWYLSLRGMVALRVFITKTEDGETDPQIRVLDPYHLAYQEGDKGLLWAAYTRRASKEQVKEEYGSVVAQDEVTVIDYWDTKNNGVIIEGRWAKPLEPHGLDYCPIVISRVGAMPPTYHDVYRYTGKHLGESIYASTRGLFPILNKTMSDLLTVVRRGVKVPLGIWSSDGQATLDEDIWQVDKAALIPLRSDIKIAPIMEPSMPRDASALVNMVLGDIQRGNYAYLTYGQVETRLSGYAINQLRESEEAVTAYAIRSMEITDEMSCRMLLDQFRRGDGFKPVEVRGRTSTNRPFGYPEKIKIRTTDIKPGWHPEVRIELSLPEDEPQRFIMANQARQGERPLLSDRTIREKMLLVDDPDLEEQLIDLEFGKNIPLVKLQRMFDAYMVEGRPDLAEYVMNEIQRLILDLKGRLASAQTQQPMMPRMERGMMPEETMSQGIPARQPGVPAWASPPEELGATPGGARGAILRTEEEV